MKTPEQIAHSRRVFWPKVALTICAIFTGVVLLGFTAMFLKSVHQYMSLPMIKIPARECAQTEPNP